MGELIRLCATQTGVGSAIGNAMQHDPIQQEPIPLPLPKDSAVDGEKGDAEQGADALGAGPTDALSGVMAALEGVIASIGGLTTSLSSIPASGTDVGAEIGGGGDTIVQDDHVQHDPTQCPDDKGKGGLPGDPPPPDESQGGGDVGSETGEAEGVTDQAPVDKIDQTDVGADAGVADQTVLDDKLKIEGGGAVDAAAGVSELMPKLVEVLTQLIEVLTQLIEAIKAFVGGSAGGGGEVKDDVTDPPADPADPPADPADPPADPADPPADPADPVDPGDDDLPPDLGGGNPPPVPVLGAGA